MNRGAWLLRGRPPAEYGRSMGLQSVRLAFAHRAPGVSHIQLIQPAVTPQSGEDSRVLMSMRAGTCTAQNPAPRRVSIAKREIERAGRSVAEYPGAQAS